MVEIAFLDNKIQQIVDMEIKKCDSNKIKTLLDLDEQI